MTCRQNDEYDVDDESRCPDEINVFVLRDGVRIDGLHVSAPASERGNDDDIRRVDVRQEQGQ
jgi:hypothetical protein